MVLIHMYNNTHSAVRVLFLVGGHLAMPWFFFFPRKPSNTKPTVGRAFWKIPHTGPFYCRSDPRSKAPGWPVICTHVTWTRARCGGPWCGRAGWAASAAPGLWSAPRSSTAWGCQRTDPAGPTERCAGGRTASPGQQREKQAFVFFCCFFSGHGGEIASPVGVSIGRNLKWPHACFFFFMIQTASVVVFIQCFQGDLNNSWRATNPVKWRTASLRQC